MNDVSKRQIRETLARYIRDEDQASGHSKIQELPTVAVETSLPTTTQIKLTAGLKDFLRNIPVVYPLLRSVYRVVKLPGRVALIARKLQDVYELQVGLVKLHDRIDALSWHVSALQQRQEKVLNLLESEAQQVHAIASDVDVSGAKSDATMPSLRSISQSVESRLEELLAAHVRTEGLIAEVSHTLIALYEKSGSDQQDLCARVEDRRTGDADG